MAGLTSKALMNPRQLVQHLDEFVVGQAKAKKVLAVAVYNHYARIRQFDQLLKQRAVAALQQEDESILAAQNSPPHVAQLQPRDRPSPSPDSSAATLSTSTSSLEATVASTHSRLQPYDRKRDSANPPDSAAMRVADSVAVLDTTISDRLIPTLFSPSYYPAPTPSPTQKRRSSHQFGSNSTASSKTTTATNSNHGLPSLGTTDPLDPTLYNSPIHDKAVPLHRKHIGRRLKSSSISNNPHQSSDVTPSTQMAKPSLPDASELLTDFVGQVSGTPFDAQPSEATSPSSWQGGPLGEDVIEMADKSNVLLLGPSGSGKTLLAKTLAKCLDVPFVAVEATGLTMAGYVGEDVETCIHRLLLASDWNVDKASKGIVFIDEIDKLARTSSSSHSKDVSGEGVQQSLLKIIEGTIVSVPDKDGQARNKIRGPPKEAHLVDTTNILFILSGAFVGLDKIVSRRLDRGSIGFTARLSRSSSATDDASKLSNISHSNDLSTNMLDNVEPVDLQHFGFIPEFIGRLPVVASLKHLTEDDLLRVLTEPKNALVKQYQDLFQLHHVDLRFTTLALRQVAKQAISKGTGARGLRSILEHVLLESMFDVPQSSVKYVLIDRQVVIGSRPAHYYSRGQKFVFENDFAAEQEEDERRASVDDNQVQAEEDGLDETQLEPRRATV
ncbi:ATP-binding protein [Microbotryomycetes sp. JL221]|nr:ATP-binding protein [Microbotryomycetes sp. JL221]